MMANKFAGTKWTELAGAAHIGGLFLLAGGLFTAVFSPGQLLGSFLFVLGGLVLSGASLIQRIQLRRLSELHLQAAALAHRRCEILEELKDDFDYQLAVSVADSTELWQGEIATQQLLEDLRAARAGFSEVQWSQDQLIDRVQQCLSSVSAQSGAAIKEAEQAIGEAIDAFLMVNDEAQSMALIDESARDEQGRRTVVHATKTVSSLADEMLEMADRMTESAQEMQSLAEDSILMNELLDQIDLVSKQTTILALNASIEAARAGHSGAAFGVIASEVTRLSNSVQEAADKTRHITNSMTQGTQGLSLKLAEFAEDGRNNATLARGSFIKLMEAVDESQEQAAARLANFSRKSQSISTGLDRVVAAFQFQDLLRQRLECMAGPVKQLQRELGQADRDDSGSIWIGAKPELTVVHYGITEDDNVELFA